MHFPRFLNCKNGTKSRKASHKYNFNQLTPKVPHHIETRILIWNTNKLTGFYMMGNINRYLVNNKCHWQTTSQPHTRGRDRQGQEMFLALSADNQACNRDTVRFIYYITKTWMLFPTFSKLIKSRILADATWTR